MSDKVTSITEARRAARTSSDQRQANSRTATTILVVVAALLVIGIAATTSASSTVALANEGDRFYFLKRQLLGIGLGLVAMVVASRVPYRLYRKAAVPMYVGTVVLLIAVLLFGRRVSGSQRWIDIAGVGFQPSELAKFTVIVALAAVMEKKRKLLGDFGHFLAPSVLVLGVAGLLVMQQPDLGTTIVIAAGGIAVLLTSAAPLRFVIYMTGGTAMLAGLLALAADYRLDRIRGFLDPWADAGDTGYQLIQSYYALGTGGLLGVGLGASRARWFYLPNAHTDFIFSIIGEETGLIGGLMVMLLFVLLAAAGGAVAARAPDGFGRMLAAGITTWLSFQALVNIGGVLGVLPITGITLPFVSFGGTAVAVSMGAVGVLVNIAHHGTSPVRSRS
jgi:cell division protein FtsW